MIKKSHRSPFKEDDTSLNDIITEKEPQGTKKTKHNEIIPHCTIDMAVIPLPFTNQLIMRQYDGYLKAYQIHCIHVSNIGFYSELGLVCKGKMEKESTPVDLSDHSLEYKVFVYGAGGGEGGWWHAGHVGTD